MSNNLANRLGLHGTAIKLSVKGINTEEVVYTKLVELNVLQCDNQSLEPFEVSPHVKEDWNVGADVIDIKALQETYPRLAFLDSVIYCYGNIEIIPGQDVYHAIEPLEYFARRRAVLAFCRSLVYRLASERPSTFLFRVCFDLFFKQKWSRILNSLVK